MNKILDKKRLNDAVELMVVHAPFVTRNCQPGQFVILRVDDEGERVPLTIADFDREAQTVTIVYQIVGFSTQKLSEKQVGDTIYDFAGPLGQSSDLKPHKRVLGIGGGVGTAPLFPQIRRLHELGAEVDIILGGRTGELVILEDWFAEFAANMHMATNDGSKGRQGFVTDVLKDLISDGKQYDEIIAIGPLPMMKAVVDITKPLGIKTAVSLNPIMIDGTGMCGGCRLTLKDETRFACVDGPDFDGFDVDFDELMSRQAFYREEEEEHKCNIGLKPSYKYNMGLTKVPMPEQPAHVRNKNFEEVALGYTEEQAIEEAKRCVQCKSPKCVDACPVNVRIPGFVRLVAEGNFKDAYRVLTSENSLPAICGRVCPQESQCESVCIRAKKGEPVAIGRLERFVADYYLKNGGDEPAPIIKNNRKVAVVGAGPAGIACAGDLAKLGYEVAIFEALHEAGGVLTYGIPEFRLPKAIVQKELESIKRLGVQIYKNVIIGKSLTIEDLVSDGYEAVFVGSGAGLPRFMKIPGENLNGVYSANEFLTRVNLMKAYEKGARTPVKIGKNAAVIGGGNVAMDAARTALRLGAESVHIVYRRGKEELPARLEEIHHAEEEGIRFAFLSNPVGIIGKDGWVSGLECIRMELGEPDASGRRRPQEVEGSGFVLDVNSVIIAIGQVPNPLIKQSTPSIRTEKWGGIIVEDDTMETSMSNVYAGGDVVSGAATVILAMGAGKKAAKSIHKKLQAQRAVNTGN